MMRIGVSSYSFSRLVQAGVLSELDLAAKAREMGFSAIEFTEWSSPGGENACDFASKIRRSCAQQGLEITCYTVEADFLRGSNGDLDAEISRVKEQVLIAAALGAPRMRHDASVGFPEDHRGPLNFESALPRLAAGCRAVTEFAAEQGIQTMVENHGYFCQDSERLEKLAAAVDHPNFGILLDIGNFACVDEDSAAAVGRLAHLARHVHVKDFHIKSGMMPFPGKGWFRSRAGNFLRGAIVGHGDIPVFQCLCILKKAGYDGPLSMEFEGLEDPIEGIALGRDVLKQFVHWLDFAGLDPA